MESRANLILEVKDELGADLAALFTDDEEYGRYLNQGQRRLGFWDEVTVSLSWAALATSESLPPDCVHVDRIVPDIGSRIPEYKVWGNELAFTEPGGATSAGSATLYYYAHYPPITGADDSELPPEGDTAIVAFACYRLFRRLVSSRADYERYATLLGANGVDLAELESIAQGYFDEFESARESLPAEEPVTFYSD